MLEKKALIVIAVIALIITGAFLAYRFAFETTGPFAIDGTSSASSNIVTSVKTSLSTTYSSDVIFCIVAGNGTSQIPTITDSSGLTWTQRSSAQSTTNNYFVFEFYALANNPLSGDQIKASIASAANMRIVSFGISGAKTSSPFDVNPVIASGIYSTQPSVSISTTNSNDMILGLLIEGGSPTITQGSGFSTIASVAFGPEVFGEYQTVSSLQSNLAVGASASPNNDWAIIADAIQAAPSGGGGGGTTSTQGSGTTTTGQSFTSTSTGSSSFEQTTGTSTISALGFHGLSFSAIISYAMTPVGSAILVLILFGIGVATYVIYEKRH